MTTVTEAVIGRNLSERNSHAPYWSLIPRSDWSISQFYYFKLLSDRLWTLRNPFYTFPILFGDTNLFTLVGFHLRYN